MHTRIEKQFPPFLVVKLHENESNNIRCCVAYLKCY